MIGFGAAGAELSFGHAFIVDDQRVRIVVHEFGVEPDGKPSTCGGEGGGGGPASVVVSGAVYSCINANVAV